MDSATWLTGQFMEDWGNEQSDWGRSVSRGLERLGADTWCLIALNVLLAIVCALVHLCCLHAVDLANASNVCFFSHIYPQCRYVFINAYFMCRCVLMVRSEYFRAMLGGDWSESGTQEIVLHE